VPEAKRPRASESTDLAGDADPAEVLLLRPGSAFLGHFHLRPKSPHRPSPVCLRSRRRTGLPDFPNTLPATSPADQKRSKALISKSRVSSTCPAAACQLRPRATPVCVRLSPISALVAQPKNLISKSRLDSYLGSRAGDKETVVAAGASASSPGCIAAPPPSPAPVPATVSASASSMTSSPSAGPPPETTSDSASPLSATPAGVTGDAVEATRLSQGCRLAYVSQACFRHCRIIPSPVQQIPQ